MDINKIKIGRLYKWTGYNGYTPHLCYHYRGKHKYHVVRIYDICGDEILIYKDNCLWFVPPNTLSELHRCRT